MTKPYVNPLAAREPDLPRGGPVLLSEGGRVDDGEHTFSALRLCLQEKKAR